MVPLLLVALSAPVHGQGAGIQVATATDKNRLQVGEEVVLSLRATSLSPAAMHAVLPSAFDGFEVISRSEVNELSGGDRPRRLLILDVRLRATRAGTWRLWPIRVEQGFQVVVAPSVSVEVADGVEETEALTRSNPVVARLLERSPPPRPGEVAVTTMLSSEEVYAGAQVDLATAAWFPRTLLARLRRAPTLKPPTVDGVWSLPQSSVPGVAASRLVAGEWYDLFVSHQVFFPLATGSVRIPPAVLTFAVPVGPQYFSEERSYQLASDAATLVVRPVPGGGAGGPVAANLSLRYQVPRGAVTAGDLIPVTLELRGEGNVALWPTPEPAWPNGVRAYPARTTERVAPSQGRIGGTKEFQFLLLPDSAGPTVLPEVRYAYFDPHSGRHLEAVAPPVVLPVLPATHASGTRAPLPLIAGPTEPPLARVWRDTPRWALATLASLPLAIFAAGFVIRIRRRPPPPVETRLSDARARLEAWVAGAVPEPADRQTGRLSRALRRRGVPAEDAEAIARAWESLRQEAFGPPAGGHDELDAEAARLLDRVAVPHGAAIVMLAVSFLLGGSASLRAQAPSAEDLYAGGQYRAAREAFLLRANRAPDNPALWYAGAASAYAAGESAISAAAFLQARRRAPRNPQVRRGWSALVGAVPGVERAGGFVSPVAPGELAVVALFFWVAGGLVIVLTPRRWRSAGGAMLGVALVGGVGAVAIERAYHRPVAVTRRAQPLLGAPHGLAGEIGSLEQFQLVAVRDTAGPWRLVQIDGGRSGWVPSEAIAEVDRLH